MLNNVKASNFKKETNSLNIMDNMFSDIYYVTLVCLQLSVWKNK
jgi:hypothetical protein